MLSKFRAIKVMLLLMAILLVINIAFGVPALANGGGGVPIPPANNGSPPDGGTSSDSLIITLLTVLDYIL